SARDAMYANLTHKLIRRSGLLLALWDGEASTLPGGTADTVLRYLGVRSDENKDDDQLEFVDSAVDLEGALLAYWIPTRRSAQSTPQSQQGPAYLSGMGDNVIQRQREMPKRLRASITQLNDYNREFSALSNKRALLSLDSLMASLPSDMPLVDRAQLE